MGIVRTAPFESEYGFRSPGFFVDEDGNITAKSIVQQVGEDEDLSLRAVDFKVELNATGEAFVINDELAVSNPTIDINRQTSYVFSLELSKVIDVDLVPTVFQIPFFIFADDVGSLYNEGLVHSDGTTGEDAQGKISGKLLLQVPVDAPDTLYYGNIEQGIVVPINVADPEGSFGNLTVNSQVDSSDINSGALIVSGGAAIGKNLYVGESIFTKDVSLDGIGIPVVSSATNLELAANYRIVVKIENSVLGVIGTEGSTIPINNTTIDGTVIGQTSPSTASFTSADVTAIPTEINNVTNKTYVDQTATALAIALGS